MPSEIIIPLLASLLRNTTKETSLLLWAVVSQTAGVTRMALAPPSLIVIELLVHTGRNECVCFALSNCQKEHADAIPAVLANLPLPTRTCDKKMSRALKYAGIGEELHG